MHTCINTRTHTHDRKRARIGLALSQSSSLPTTWKLVSRACLRASLSTFKQESRRFNHVRILHIKTSTWLPIVPGCLCLEWSTTRGQCPTRHDSKHLIQYGTSCVSVSWVIQPAASVTSHAYACTLVFFIRNHFRTPAIWFDAPCLCSAHKISEIVLEMFMLQT